MNHVAATKQEHDEARPASRLAGAKIFLHSRQGLGVDDVRAAYTAGLVADPAPYAFNAAELRCRTISYSQDRPQTRLQRYLFSKLQFDLVHAWRNRAAIRRADIIWTMLEWEWVPIALLQRIGLIGAKPIIGNSVWLCNNWPHWGWRRRTIWKLAMTRHVYQTLHSQRAAELAKDFFAVPFHLCPFGISTQAFPVTPPLRATRDRPIKLYAIGDDATRDWQTMLDAFGNDENFALTIVCRWIDDSHLAKYRNLTIPRDVTIAMQRALYQSADIVIIPMRENCFSGITVACEAAAMGKPVICADTGGVAGYFGRTEITYVPPRDAAALRNAVLQTTPDEFYQQALRAQARFLASGYSAPALVERYIRITEQMLTRPAAKA